MGEEEYRELLNYLRAYTAPPMIAQYEEPRIEFAWRDVNMDMQLLQKLMSTTMLTAKMPIAVYDEEQEPCTDEELQEFLFSS